jgi:UDP-N-acetylmuramoyl-L-alanyl-D-glutamate--2,6-diaminopimelate ligase
VQNSVLALAAGNVCGLNWGRLASSIEYVPQIPGRLERVGEASDRGFEIFVDYAHTPDALLNALESLRGLTKGRLAVVFGCGGDRDIGKRSEMGAIAAKLADRVILTWDNPRSEDPDVILRDIQQGVDKAVELRDPAPEVSVEPDRGEAIRAGIGSLSDGDTLLIAGKGHEDYQIVGDKVRPFSDIEHTRRVLKSLKMN